MAGRSPDFGRVATILLYTSSEMTDSMPEQTYAVSRSESDGPPWALGALVLVVIVAFLAHEAEREPVLGMTPFLLLGLAPIFQPFIVRGYRVVRRFLPARAREEGSPS